MARLKLFLPLLIFIALAGLFYKMLGNDYNPQDLPSALIGQTLPEFTLAQLEDDKPLSKKDIIGEPMLLNVWATWCPSCRVEHPYLNQLKAQGIKIIGLDYKDERKKALQWLADLGDPYAVNLYDVDGSLGLDLGVYGAPETYLIDANGMIIDKHVGVIDDKVWKKKLRPQYLQLKSQ